MKKKELRERIKEGVFIKYDEKDTGHSIVVRADSVVDKQDHYQGTAIMSTIPEYPIGGKLTMVGIDSTSWKIEIL